MPKTSSLRVPSYRRHKPTGQAVVTINGRDLYLGKWNTAASRAEYDRLIAEFLTNGRRLQGDADGTVVEVLNAYRKFAENYYRKDGRVTCEYGLIKDALKLVRELYGRTTANEFGPLALKAVRQRMIDKGWSRSSSNKSIGQIRRCFKWAVENELVRPDMYHGLMAVSGLRRDRSEAREPDPVQPVDDATVQATLPHLTPVVADMIRFQRITGCRPQDVCNLRPCDIDMAADVWLYRPSRPLCWAPWGGFAVFAPNPTPSSRRVPQLTPFAFLPFPQSSRKGELRQLVFQGSVAIYCIASRKLRDLLVLRTRNGYRSLSPLSSTSAG